MRELKDGTVVLSVGFSPCPNDTYIFDALVNGKIDTGKLRFEPLLEDVEQLNRRATEVALDVTKLSFRAYADVSHDYVLCNAGSALGFGVGPLLVARSADVRRSDDFTVAVPGLGTTANFLFRIFHPHVTRFREMVFSDIEDAVVSGEVDAGVIIHENRFTYRQKGLVCLADLGSLWEQETGQPIPLGGIAVKRSLPLEVRLETDKLIRSSLDHANLHPESSSSYVAAHARSMDPIVREKHIRLYVNEHSLDLGEGGRSAVRYFYQKALSAGVIGQPPTEPLFLPEP
ncbi:MAG: hypothetical protein RL213_210 [Bacteroidota bacterium]|jgi:1,4-dihydroxy-6-naphthoate synthase